MTNSPENFGISNETIEAFHTMWDTFPQPVMLLLKCRDIVAVNKYGQEKGVPTTGRCYQLGGQVDEIHAGCKANQAVEEGVAQRSVHYNKDTNRVMDAYWLPVLTEKDLYMHFAINTDLNRSQ